MGGELPAERLDHLTGARCLASLWIVCGHFAPRLEETAFTAARHRGNAAVNFFIILSGFITHWVYAKRLRAAKSGQVLRFYIRRIGRVVLTTWIAMLFGLLVVMVQLRGRSPDLGHVLRCFLFVETWLDPIDWCPNGQTWTVAALIPSWLLYPATCRAVIAVADQGGRPALVALCFALWASALVPMVWCFLRQGYWLSNVQGIWSYVWPPAQVGDFGLGVATAELARRSPGTGRWGSLVSDLCVLVVLLAAFAVPSSGAREGWEPFFGHALGPFFALFLAASAGPGAGGGAAALLAHESLQSLGAYSFEVYLFQYPVHELFVATGDISGAFSMRNPTGKYNNNSCGFVVFVFCLWLSAGLYMELAESYLMQWLKRISEESPTPRYEPLELNTAGAVEVGQAGTVAPL